MRVQALAGVLLSCVNGRETSASVALTMEGGGWRAQTAYAGVVSGLMAVLSEDTDASPTLHSTGLLDRFDHFSSVSGGSWFFASTAYSQRYNDLLNGMAASPTTAAAQMNANWTTPLLEATKVDPANWDVVAKIAHDLVDKLIGTGDADSLYLLTYFLATNATWNAFTAVQLEAAASIGPDVKMGSDVMSWANDKVWLCDHSVLLPSGKKFARLYQGDLDVPSARYVAQGSDNIPIVTPAKFSIQMGAGEASSAPHPYVADTAVPVGVDLDFKGVAIPIIDEPSAVSAPLDVRDFSDGVFVDGAGQLPVSDVASASSAAAGIAPVLGLLADEALAIIDADLTPWASNTAGGASFGTAIELVQRLKDFGGVSQDSMNALAAAKVHGLIDGGYTDDTGLANVVAAGANEVVLLLDSSSSTSSFHIELLCKDGPPPAMPDALHSAIFETPASTVNMSWPSLQTLALQNTQFLKNVAFGSFNLTTADNSLYGVSAGRPITIHVVQISGDVTIGVLEDIDNYNTYVQEIIQTLVAAENAELVKGTLLPMFTGRVGGTYVV